MSYFLNRILVIDDCEEGSNAIEQHLEGEPVFVETFPDAEWAIAKAEDNPPDLLVIDVDGAVVNVLGLCSSIRRNPHLYEIPVAVVVSAERVEERVQAYDAGADAVIHKPFEPEELKAIVRNVLRLNRFRKLAEQRDQLQRMLLQVQSAYDATIEGWMKALDLRDRETEGHSLRVAEMTLMLADELSISPDELVQIRRGALLHDIGKLAIPDSILKKPGRLTDEERDLINQHPLFAYRMLSEIEYLRPCLDIPVYHHEKYDGTGYPFGLAGEGIPVPARIFSIVDVWDALSFDRPYRKAWPQERVCDYLASQSGTHFDPRVVDAFMRLVEQLGDPLSALDEKINRPAAA